MAFSIFSQQSSTY